MNPQPPVQPMGPNTNQLTTPLMERMDPAIGEASSVMGAMVTELIRRSLRGGVLQLGQELGAFVGEKVDATLAEKTPVIEQVAAEVADNAARAAATEVVKEEVLVLEQKTRDNDEQVAAQLTTRIHQAEKHATDVTRETARGLTSQIEEAEKRAIDLARAEIERQIADLLEKSKKGVAALKERIQVLEGTTTGLAKHLLDEQAERRAEQAALKAELRESSAALVQELADLRQSNEALLSRVTELEKPRGLRKWFGWLAFWRKKKSPVKNPGEPRAPAPEEE